MVISTSKMSNAQVFTSKISRLLYQSKKNNMVCLKIKSKRELYEAIENQVISLIRNHRPPFGLSASAIYCMPVLDFNKLVPTFYEILKCESDCEVNFYAQNNINHNIFFLFFSNPSFNFNKEKYLKNKILSRLLPTPLKKKSVQNCIPVVYYHRILCCKQRELIRS